MARVDALFTEIAEGEAALAEARKDLHIFRRALLKAAINGELTTDWRAANPVAETGHDLLDRIAKDRAKIVATKGRRPRGDGSPFYATSLPELLKVGYGRTPGRSSGFRSYRMGHSPKKSKDGSGTLALKLTATTKGQIDLQRQSGKGSFRNDLSRIGLVLKTW